MRKTSGTAHGALPGIHPGNVHPIPEIQMAKQPADRTRHVQSKSITILPKTVSEATAINEGSVCLTGQSKYSAPEDTGLYRGYPLRYACMHAVQ